DVAERTCTERVFAGQEHNRAITRPNADVSADLYPFDAHFRARSVHEKRVRTCDGNFDVARIIRVPNDIELRAVEHRPVDPAAARINTIREFDRYRMAHRIDVERRVDGFLQRAKWSFRRKSVIGIIAGGIDVIGAICCQYFTARRRGKANTPGIPIHDYCFMPNIAVGTDLEM